MLLKQLSVEGRTSIQCSIFRNFAEGRQHWVSSLSYPRRVRNRRKYLEKKKKICRSFPHFVNIDIIFKVEYTTKRLLRVCKDSCATSVRGTDRRAPKKKRRALSRWCMLHPHRRNQYDYSTGLWMCLSSSSSSFFQIETNCLLPREVGLSLETQL